MEEVITILHKLFQTREKGKTRPTQFYEVWLPKPDKDIEKKENYRAISHEHDAKILNRILIKQIKRYIKRDCTLCPLDLFQEGKVILTFEILHIKQIMGRGTIWLSKQRKKIF